MVIIDNMKKKPEDCIVCPLCNGGDDCDLLPKYYKSWDEQYADCPLREVEEGR